MKNINNKLIVGLLALCFGSASQAAIIEYSVTDLADVGTGDLWRYDYSIFNDSSDTNFLINQVTIFFIDELDL